MVSANMPPRRPILTLDDLAPRLTRSPERLHALTAADLSIAFSQGLDIAEGKLAGHAQRVCYIAMSLADSFELDAASRAGVYFGALLHDLGVTLAASELCRDAGVDEGAIFGPAPLHQIPEGRGAFGFADRSDGMDAVHQHALLGEGSVHALDLPEEAAVAVRSHHERWDGTGFPYGLAGEAIPLQGRILAVADWAEVLIAEQPSSLVARRNFVVSLNASAGLQHDPMLVGALLKLTQSDRFWLGLYSGNLTEVLSLRRPSEARKSRKLVTRFAEVFADLSDTKRGRTIGQSRRTADSAELLAKALSLEPGHSEMIRVAALLQDVGQFGVPARVISKPDILSVTEMQVMRQHPANSEMILEQLTGFEEIAIWIARHHERPDGKGYPEGLTGDDIPLEARILAVTDVFAALTSDRAHRRAVSRKDARKILLGAAGTQLDAELVRLFLTLI